MTTAALASPVLGALAVLTFGGLAGRLAGPQWAPPAALILAVTLPEQYTSRSAFTEPLAQLLLLGGLCLVADSLTVRRGRRWLSRHPGRMRWPGWLPPSMAAAALGGLALGLAPLASLTVLPYLIPVIPFTGLLVAARRPQALPLAVGVLTGAGYAIARQLGDRAGRARRPRFPGPAGQPDRAGVAVVTVTAVAITAWPPARAWAGRAARGALRWRVPDVAAGLVVAVLIAFLIRPSIQTAHWDPGPGIAGYVGALQKLLGLPVQPTRSYAEDTLYWVIWYIGIPALLLGGFGMALLTRRCVRALLRWADEDGVAWVWGLPLAIFAWTTVSVLWDPRTVPDQPWASRTLVPLVLPGFILCAVWVAAWLDRRARERGAGRSRRSPGRGILRPGHGGADRRDHLRHQPEPRRDRAFQPRGHRRGREADRRGSGGRRPGTVRDDERPDVGRDPRPAGRERVRPGDPGHVRRPGRGDGGCSAWRRSSR